MYYGEIKNCDIANGIGVRVSLFVSGCLNRCKNCFQPETWNFKYGKPFDSDAEDYIISLLNKPYIKGLSLLGGEPMEPENQKDLLPFLQKVKNLFPDKDIWLFTGFTYEELLSDNCRGNCPQTLKILKLTDIMVDGRYDESLKNIALKFRGSENQRIIDVQKTLKNKSVILADI